VALHFGVSVIALRSQVKWEERIKKTKETRETKETKAI